MEKAKFFPKVFGKCARVRNAKISKLAKKKKKRYNNNSNDRTSPAFRSFGKSSSMGGILTRMQTLSAEDAFESLTIQPAPLLWKVLTDVQYRDIFETHILWRLDELSFRVFREVNRESRDAIRRSKRKLPKTYKVFIWTGNPPVYRRETRKNEGKHAQYHFCSQAARSGNLELLRWLREEKKFEWDAFTINTAAIGGDLHIVKYCMEQKCPRSEKCPRSGLTCALAARHGHLDVLKYLRENGALWSSWTCFFARENNHLECLNYAKENGCPDTLNP